MAVRLEKNRKLMVAKADRTKKLEALKQKTFGELTQPEKDSLLQLVAEKLGIIKAG